MVDQSPYNGSEEPTRPDEDTISAVNSESSMPLIGKETQDHKKQFEVVQDHQTQLLEDHNRN